MKKILALILTFALASTLLIGCGSSDDTEYHVGILQVMDHPALNAATEGFISGLADEGFVRGENLTITTNIGGGTDADQMAAEMVASGMDLMLGNSTGSSQALQRATRDIPIVFTSVTNPLGSGLVIDNDAPGTNLTGMSDRPNFGEQVEFLRRIFPDAQTVGIIYNSGEVNSVYQADIFERYLTSFGITVIRYTVTGTADVAGHTTSLAQRVDVILTPTCNTMAAAMATAVNSAAAAGVAIIAGDSGSVSNGALATYGINYYMLGRQAAAIAAQILRGEIEPETTPVQWQETLQIYVNASTAAHLGINIPDDVMAAAIVFGE